MRASPLAAAVPRDLLISSLRVTLMSIVNSAGRFFGLGLNALLSHSSLRAFRDASSPARAIHELVRFDSSFQVQERICVTPTAVGGVPIAPRRDGGQPGQPRHALHAHPLVIDMLMTFGHGTATAEEITGLLRGAEVAAVVDIRTAPGSRRHPHVARAELEQWLPAAGIAYRWDKRLGGFRKPRPETPDTAWREEMFRGYAGHMRTAEFGSALDEVLAQAAQQRTAVMCSESVWWRCHRRLAADFAVAARGVDVRHLMHDGRLAEHRLSPGLRLRDDGLLVYDAGQQTLEE